MSEDESYRERKNENNYMKLIPQWTAFSIVSSLTNWSRD